MIINKIFKLQNLKTKKLIKIMNSDFCQICCWNDVQLEFNDEDYANAKYNNSKNTCYNWVINPNNYNRCFVCYECLYEKIYEINTELFLDNLYQFKIYFELSKIMKKYNIPIELFKIILKIL